MRTKTIGLYVSVALLLGAAGCKSNPANPPASTDATTASNGDPAAANLAPPETLNPGQPTAYSGSSSGSSSSAGSTSQPARVLGQSAQAPAGTQQGEDYSQQQGYANGGGSDDYAYNNEVDAGQQAIEANAPPPPLPVYDQPPAPEPDDQWTPGYWNYGQSGYYWVPGFWCAAPFVGALWTPPYWGFYGGHYRFHHGYWGRHVGFYGGVPYGFGYTGYGYEGGYWRGNDFYYNRAVTRVNVNVIHTVYEHNVTVNNNYSRVSYNGGPGGWNVRPRPSEVAALREQRVPPMQTQLAVQHEAQQNKAMFFAQNHGAPPVAVRPQPVAAVRGIQPPPVRNAAPQPGRENAEQQRAPQQNAQPHENQPHPEPQRGQPQPETPRGNQNQPQNHGDQPETRPGRENQPQQPPPHPENQGRPHAQPTHPQPTQQPRPEAHPQPQPARPQPQPARPEPQPARPQPQPTRPQEARPQPQEPRPTQETRPTQEPRQTQEPRPQAQPHPEPQHAAPPASHPAPAAHEDHPKH
jgi:hypothetical protein